MCKIAKGMRLFTLIAFSLLMSAPAQASLDVVDFLNMTGTAPKITLTSPVSSSYLQETADGVFQFITDDDMYFTVPGTTSFSGGVKVGKVLSIMEEDSGIDLGSRIHDNGNLRIDTNDDLYITAPGTTYVSSDLQVAGGYGSTGVTVSDAGNIQTNGTLTVDGTSTLTGNVTVAGTLTVTGNNTFTGDIAVNGGDLTTTAATFNLVNGATTVNLGSTNAARTVNVGTGTAVDTINIGTGATGADVVTIGQAAANVAITDAQWSVTGAGAGSFASVASTAATTVGNALTVTAGGATITAGGLTVTAGGATIAAGTLAANAGITVDTTAFTVADTTGNVATTGTLGVTGTATFTGAVAANGDTTIGNLGTDILTVTASIAGASPLVLEGGTANDFETTLAVTEPTADNTITIPNISGTLITTGDTGTVTSTIILDSTVASADIAADTIVAADIATGGVGAAEIGDDVIDGADLADTITLDAALTLNSADVTIGQDLTVSGGDVYVTGKADAGTTTAGAIYFDTDDSNLYVYDGTAWRDLTAGAAGSNTLDDAYNTSAGASTILVDNGDLTFRSNAGATGDIIIDLNSTGDFVLQDAGADVITFSDTGNLTIATGTLALNNDAVTADGDLLITGATGWNATATLGDLDITSTAGSIILTAGESANDAMQIIASAGGIDITSASGTDGEDIDITSTGTTGEIRVTTASTTADAFRLNASAGGLDIDAATGIAIDLAGAATEDIIVTNTGGSIQLVATEAALDGINIDATGGVDIDAADDIAISVTSASDAEDLILEVTGATNSSVLISSSGTGADAISLITSAGGLDITVAGAAAGEDLDLTTNTSVNISATESVNDAIVLSASAGGIDILSTSGTDGEDIDVTSTGTTGEIRITTASTTADAFRLFASAGGIDVDADGNAIVITGTADLAAEDVSIIQDGAVDASVVLTSSGTGDDAIDMNTTAGGIDITVAGAAAGEDFQITTNTSVDIDANEDAADAIQITTSAGGIDITAGGNTAGDDLDIAATGVATEIRVATASTEADAFRLNASAGGLDIDADDGIAINAVGAAGEDIVVTNTGGSITLVATEAAADAINVDSSGGFDIDTTGAAGGVGDIDLSSDLGSVVLKGDEAVADAISLDANDAAGTGVTIATGETAGLAYSGGPITLTAAAIIATPVANTNQDLTPTAKDAVVMTITNTIATTITDFDDDVAGQILIVHFVDGNTTLADGATFIQLDAEANTTPTANDVIIFVNVGGVWYQAAPTSTN